MNQVQRERKKMKAYTEFNNHFFLVGVTVCLLGILGAKAGLHPGCYHKNAPSHQGPIFNRQPEEAKLDLPLKLITNGHVSKCNPHEGCSGVTASGFLNVNRV